MTTDFIPRIPDRVRTVAWIVGLVVAVLAILVPSVALEFAPDVAASVDRIIVAIEKATLLALASLGVAYRPTGPRMDGAIKAQGDGPR